MSGIVSAVYHTATVNEVKAEVETLEEKLKRSEESLEQMTNARDFHIGEVERISTLNLKHLSESDEAWRLAASRDRARIAELESLQEADAKTINDAALAAVQLTDSVENLEREIELLETRATLANTRRALKAALRMESDQ